MNKLELLHQRLEAAAASFDELQEIFFVHTQSSFLNDYFSSELASMAKDSNYPVGGISGQLNLKLINADIIDYTVHLRMASSYKPNVKWMGTSQLMAIKGSGTVDARILRMPSSSEINLFCKGVPVAIVGNKTMGCGDTLSCRAPHEIIEIMDINGTVIMEILTVKDSRVNLFWNFGEDLQSTYPESSSLVMSRLATILNVVNKMKVPAPEGLYDFIFHQGDANLKLRAVQTMLKEGLDLAFDKLNEFIESDDPALSLGARTILNRLLQPELT